MDMRLNPEDFKDSDSEIVQFTLEQVREAQENPMMYSRMHHRHYKTGGWDLRQRSQSCPK